ncbi:hypothetical protein HWV62_11421 [Athelia sp. TMB]|nr:hypothetical protein HWV62_11421 [Athelia sp. TMB]
MYWDKRFQTDLHFPIIALNHEQIKDSVTGGYLMVKKKDFKHMSDRLIRLDMAVMSDLSRHLQSGERIKKCMVSQNLCFQAMHDIDLIGKHVQGSRTTKKFRRNEIWSMIEFQGAPSWFITFALADSRSPICLYYTDHDLKFKPEIIPEVARFGLITDNPVAGRTDWGYSVKLRAFTGRWSN